MSATAITAITPACTGSVTTRSAASGTLPAMFRLITSSPRAAVLSEGADAPYVVDALDAVRGDEFAAEAVRFAESITAKLHAYGVTLEDDTNIHFPPHQGGEVRAIVDEKSEVEVAGRRIEDPKGKRHFRADLLRNTKTKESVSFDKPPKKGPPMKGPPHEQILAEITEVTARWLAELDRGR